MWEKIEGCGGRDIAVGSRIYTTGNGNEKFSHITEKIHKMAGDRPARDRRLYERILSSSPCRQAGNDPHCFALVPNHSIAWNFQLIMMNYGTQIMIVDPEKETRKGLSNTLSKQGYRVIEAGNGEEGIAKAIARPPDLIILEFRLPDMDGVEFCGQIRQWSELPILALSTQGEEMDIVKALDAGADDYIVKPFNLLEFLARVRAALRWGRPNRTANILSFGNIEVDLDNHLVRRNGIPVKLTSKEYKLLIYLMKNTGMLLTYPMILSQIWGPEHKADVPYLRVYVSQLRKKLDGESSLPGHILNEPQVGYRFIS